MPLPIMVEDQTQVPEGMQDYYQESEDGKFILAVDDVDNHPNVSGLKSAYQKEKEKRQQVAKQRDAFKHRAELLPEDIDEERLQQVLDKMNAGDDDPPDKNKPDPAKIKADIEKRFQKQLDDLNEGVKSKDQKIRRLVIDNGLTGALAKNKVTNPTFQRAAKRLLEDQIKVSETEDGGVVATVETDMGEVSLDQFVQNWTAGDEGSAFVDGSSGSGARGASSSPKGGKQLTRAQFEQLGAAERSEFFKKGGQIAD